MLIVLLIIRPDVIWNIFGFLPLAEHKKDITKKHWLPLTFIEHNTTETFLEKSSFMLHRIKSHKQVSHDIRVNKCWQIFYFGVIHTIVCLYARTELALNKEMKWTSRTDRSSKMSHYSGSCHVLISAWISEGDDIIKVLFHQMMPLTCSVPSQKLNSPKPK